MRTNCRAKGLTAGVIEYIVNPREFQKILLAVAIRFFLVLKKFYVVALVSPVRRVRQVHKAHTKCALSKSSALRATLTPTARINSMKRTIIWTVYFESGVSPFFKKNEISRNL